MKPTKLPIGWDERRVREVIEYYGSQTDDEAVEEPKEMLVEVPIELLPLVRELIAKFRVESSRK